MRLPAQTKEQRFEMAAFSPADIAAVSAFAASISRDGETPYGKDTVTIPATAARLFWEANQPGAVISFDRSRLEYFNRSKVVPKPLVKAASDAASKEARFRLFDVTLKMSQGKLSVPEWTVEHDRWVKVLHGSESALGRGGLLEMTQADWLRAQERTAYQFGFSRAYYEDVANGRYGVPGDDFMADAALNRTRQYADAGRCTYENTVTENARDRLGHTHARRIVASGVNSCPDCIAVAARMWIPIREYPEIGSDQCRSGCQCITITGIEGNLIERD